MSNKNFVVRSRSSSGVIMKSGRDVTESTPSTRPNFLMERTKNMSSLSYKKEDILRSLDAMAAPRDRIVLVHTSLRTVGNVEGGAATRLDALIEHFTAEGRLLCVPTHTWRKLKKEITLDFADHSTCLGAFSDFAAADGRGLRSENPTHSMVVFGNRERAERFIRDDAFVKSPTAPESCYGKLYREGGYVLLLGVSHTKNTYLHAVAEILNMPNHMNRHLG